MPPLNNQQGFVVTNVSRLINRVNSGYLWVLPFGWGCCASEIKAGFSRYDLARSGVKLSKNLMQAEVLLVNGVLTNKAALGLRAAYDQLSPPKWVVAVGSCANGGGAYCHSYSVVQGCDRIVPVDIYIPGCPPTAAAVLYGLLQLQAKITNNNIYP